MFLRIDSLLKHPFLTSSSPLGTFRAEERLRLRGRNSILMTQINVFIINPVVMGFQIWICTILLVFWSILHGKVLCSSAHELQQNSSASCREHYIPQMLTVLSEILRVYIWPLWPFVFYLATPSTNQRFWPDSGQILRHQYGISVAETQTFLLAKRPQWRRARRNGCFRRLEKWLQ